VFRPACDGRYQPQPGKPPRLTIVDASAWPGIPITTWAQAEPGLPYTRPRGRGVRPIPEDIPVACWLPVKYGLNPHGMRHGHKTWMAEDGPPEILAEHRLGHEVPSMRGLYADTSERMRKDLKAALQAR
jgi:integrase